MSLKDGTPMHIEMISRKEVLLRKDANTTLTGGLEKIKPLRGILQR